jgi:hypothetical protein
MIHKSIQTLTGLLKVSLPGTLDELRLEQLMALQQAEQLTDLQAIHILSGVPLQELQQVKYFNDLQIFNEQVQLLANQIKELYNSNAIPKEVTLVIEGAPSKIKITQNLSVEPAGAFMATRDAIAEEISSHITRHGEADWQQHFNPSLKLCSYILAQYLYCRATGKPYDELLASEFTTQVKQLPVTEALPIAKYFFLSYPNLSKPRTGFWPHLHRLWSSVRASKLSRVLNISTL